MPRTDHHAIAQGAGSQRRPHVRTEIVDGRIRRAIEKHRHEPSGDLECAPFSDGDGAHLGHRREQNIIHGPPCKLVSPDST